MGPMLVIRMQTLLKMAVKERAKLGFFRRVKDFVFGRHGCGNIKFMTEMTMQAAAATMMIKQQKVDGVPVAAAVRRF